MDFDDLLLFANILFRDHAEVLAKYQRQFHYVLVDEYQDTNFAQHLIVSRLCDHHHNVFVVGDDAQSIYSFRGANIDNMLRFKDHYPDCRIFKLEQNYRSTQNIVDAANSLIEKNREQIKKTVYSKNEKGNKITVFSSHSDFEEGTIVSNKIGEMKQRLDCSFSDFAILYRTNAQSRVFEEALHKRMINYKVYGALSFYQRKEIKDVLAYLRMIVNPKDEEALKRIINYPLRGIGQTTVEKLQHVAIEAHISLWDVISSLSTYLPDINQGTTGRIMRFKDLIDDLQMNNKQMNAAEIGELTINDSGMRDLFLSEKTVENISRLENVNELLHAMKEFVASRIEEGSNAIYLTDFLMEVSLLTDQDHDKDEFADKVTLMTVHSAKGLEYKNVFIVGMENDLFPSARASKNEKGIEEERRLFYVAITRAKENCIITYATNRFRNGVSNIATPSYFLNDIDDSYIDFIDNKQPGLHHFVRNDRETDLQDSYQSSRNPAWDTDVDFENTMKSMLSFLQTKQKNDGKAVSGSRVTTVTKKEIVSLAGFRVGDQVVHGRFGEGVVITLEGEEGDAKATVDFTNTGIKNLLLKYAKLKLLSS